MPQMRFGEFIHAMQLTACIQGEAHDHRIIIGRYAHIMPRQYRHVIFQILANFQHAWIAEQWAQPFQSCVQFDLNRLFREHICAAMCQRNITRLPRRDR